MTGKTENKNLVDLTKHKIVYRFKYIYFISGLMRMKRYLPIGTALIFPILILQESSGKLAVAFLCANVLQFIIIEAVAKLCHNIIGTVFVNKTGDVNEVIIRSLDNMGNRFDKCYQPDNLMVYGFDRKENEIAGFVSVGVQNSDKKYKLNIKNCQICDVESFKLLFGNEMIFKQN